MNQVLDKPVCTYVLIFEQRYVRTYVLYITETAGQTRVSDKTVTNEPDLAALCAVCVHSE